MNNQDYKLKYQDLKLKFHDAVDTAFQLGMEQGLQQAQVQQAQQDQAAAQAAQRMPGQPGEDPNAQPGQDPNSPESPDGSELDQHIGKLESMLQKSDPTAPQTLELKKSLEGIKAFQSSLKQASDLKKSEKAITAIGKAMKPVFTLSKGATKNLSEHGKKALNMQEQIVNDVMRSFAEEEAHAAAAIAKTLNFEQVLKD
jgi:hypothetical protein